VKFASPIFTHPVRNCSASSKSSSRSCLKAASAFGVPAAGQSAAHLRLVASPRIDGRAPSRDGQLGDDATGAHSWRPTATHLATDEAGWTQSYWWRLPEFRSSTPSVTSSQQYFSLRTNQSPAISRNQPAVLFSQNKPAPAISHQPTEQHQPSVPQPPWSHQRATPPKTPGDFTDLKYHVWLCWEAGFFLPTAGFLPLGSGKGSYRGYCGIPLNTARIQISNQNR
jgi:hypothetical protein